MQRFTLADVLAQESLGLRLMTSERGALDRLVMGAHGTEALHPMPWMQHDWVLLITGVRLVDRPDLQRHLVEELADGGLAALGFGVGIDFDEVPGELTRAAEERGFPVFEIPLRTPFREIITFVNRSLLSTEVHQMRRLTSMREFLLDALQDAEPQQRVVQRLASLLSCTVALFGVDGRLLHASGPVPPDELWDAVALHAKGGAPEVRGTPPAIAAVRDRELVAGWLIVVRRSLDSDVYARPLVEMTAALLSTLAGVQRISAGRRRAEHAAFVSDLLAGTREDEVWRHRAAELGLELGGPVALRAIAAAGGPPDALAGRLDAALAAPPALSRLTARRGEAAVAVVQAPDAELRGRLDELYRRLGDAAIAVGRRAATVHELRDSIADALRSVTGEAGRGAEVVWYEDLDLLSWLLRCGDDDGLARKARAVLEPLAGDAVLLETLDRYFACGLHVVRTARSLGLHPNSLRYRLSRIEERLGRSLQDPETIAALHLARRASR
ncbi:PucR family transcriptional regulator [Capillimicrobium parvum]|uniref:PucR family transcriptional regulator n=1 Tax=Capillimicrobium parvum TaxID=2884022 RepID=A0A9E6XUJ7_9ACTN|nr:PucR family transcriptional regulator [Capillimicrobium parvum]UGS34730.1 hypothetical protein DSM104329_01112 [Capillimicrobium parvum]